MGIRVFNELGRNLGHDRSSAGNALKERQGASRSFSREDLSPDEIRERVRRGLEKARRVRSGGDLRMGQSQPDHDITKEKLRTLINNGGFNFNPKESKVLREILSK